MKKRNLKYISSIGLLAVFFMISFVLLTYLLRPVTNSRKNLCGFYAEADQSLDMVYIGGSACYAFWEPLSAWEEYGFTSYDFAVDALQPQSVKYMLKEIRKTQAPQLYVIDVRPFQYGNELNEEENVINMKRVAPFRNLSDNMKLSANRVELIRQWAPEQEEEWTYQFDIAKYHSNLQALISLENWNFIFNQKYLYTKGFDYYTQMNPVSFEDMRGVTAELPLEEAVDTLFVDLLEYCKEEGLQVLFIVHAYCNTDTDQQKYNYMEKKIGEYGFGFLNVNDYFYEIGLDTETDFQDVNHVNLLGADKYTDFLADYIDKNYDLPDKRKDSGYVRWNRDYIRWQEETEIVRKQMRSGQQPE